MRDAAGNLEFEDAARYRDEIKRLEAIDLEIPTTSGGIKGGLDATGKPLPDRPRARSTAGNPGQSSKFNKHRAAGGNSLAATIFTPFRPSPKGGRGFLGSLFQAPRPLGGEGLG